jgi:transaldolase
LPSTILSGMSVLIVGGTVNVDVDYMDPEWIKSMAVRHNFKFHDQTSNQIFVDIAIGHGSNQQLLLQTAKELKNEGWLKIYTRVVREQSLPPT